MPRAAKPKPDASSELEQLKLRVQALEAEHAAYVEATQLVRLQAAILANMTEWVTAMDLEGCITYTSPSIENILGYAPAEVIGRCCAKIYWRGLEVPPSPQVIHEATLREGGWRGETFHRTKDGRAIVVSLQTSTIKDDVGKVTGLICVTRDITDQKRTQEALAKSEERFREIADLLPITVCEMDRQLHLTYVNKTGLDTFGYSTEEIRKLNSIFDLIHPEDRILAIDRSQRVLHGEHLTNEYRMLRRDGAEVQMLVNSAPIFENGEIAGFRCSITDVTAYKRAQRELVISEERHRMLIEAMNDGIGVQDENGVLIQVNDRLCSMIGFSDEEMLGRRTIDLMDEEARGIFLREVAKRKERDRTPYEITFTRRDGTKIPTIMSPAPLFDADGKFRSSFAVLTDITEHKRAEEAVLKERHLLRNIIDSVPDAIFVKDKEGRYLLSNMAHCRGLGVSDDAEIEGKTDFDFLPKDMAEAVYAAEQDLLLSGDSILNREDEVPDPSGGTRWVHSIKVPLRSLSGETEGIIGVSRDITTRKKALEALRITEERFRSILDNSRDIAYKLSLTTGRYEYFSPCIKDLLGFTPEEALTMSFDEVESRIHPDDHDNFVQQRKRLFLPPSEDTPPYLVEYRLRHRNGEYRWFAESATTVWDNNRVTGIVGTLRDITSRKRVEEAMLSSSRMEATATLAGGIAHDFNNLMVGVLGNAELLQLKLGERPDITRYLTNIAKSAQQAGDLAQKMLAFARGGKYQPQILNLNQSILETLSLEERSFPPNIRLERDLESNLWPVRADSAQMGQVVMNLSINAVESIEGQGRVTIITRNMDIDEEFAKMHSGLQPGRYVYLAVEDTGKGMSREVKRRVFEPFFTTKFQGRGLGLAAVYGIIRNHSGFISVYSEEGQGTSFKVYLPAVCEAAEPVKKTGSAERPAGTETILVIDDEEMVLSVTREILEVLGYKVLVAHNGREAIDMVKEYDGPIHLSILDLGMPVMGGVQAYPHLMAARPGMKVIVCSGYELSPAAQSLLSAGANAFVQKPFRADLIAEEVHRALNS